MVNRLGAGTKVGQLGIWNGTEWVAGDPDCNIVKWGGTALTGRDITTLLDHLNVDLDTRARLQPWYQTNFAFVSKSYWAHAVAPHAYNQRFTYTVPANRIFICTTANAFIMRETAPTTAALVEAYVKESAGDVIVTMAEQISSTVGINISQSIGSSMILPAGRTIIGVTADASIGGAYTYHISFSGIEFDT